ncbi:MAG: MMPL family transporter, partial [Desulfobacteraceae bacterium]|nr:MMPL family transporter [Desulfobacteraceae bacterium]
MFDDYFFRLYGSIQRSKWLVAVLAATIIIAAVIGLKSISFDNNIELMLPGNDEVYRSIRFLRESNLSDKVILSLGLTSSEYTTKDLIDAVKKLRESLGPPLVTDVISGISENNLVEEMLELLKYAPQLIDKQNLLLIEKQINPSGVKESLQNNYRQFLTPASTLIIPFIRSDPLGIYSNILRSLQKIYSSVGYEVTVENGYFISKDRKHAMLILDTPVNLTDGFGSRKLISYLNDRLNILPDFISADIIAGHLHTVSNEDVIKRDIRLTLIIASAAFILLFILVFRDFGAIIIFLIPLVSVIVSINISNLIFNKLSYFIIGMGAVIAGIAVDYGIHVYTAVRIGNSRQEAVNSIAKPLIIGALTTISVFASFFFSSVQGYHQLAFFSILSIILCLACSLFILPNFLTEGKYKGFDHTLGRYGSTIKQNSSDVSNTIKSRDKIIVFCWGFIMITALILSKNISFNSEISQFDGSDIEIIKAEYYYFIP